MQPKQLALEIQKYQVLWREILHVPSENQAGMFLVDGYELKAKLLRICGIIVDLYVNAIYDYILRVNIGLFNDTSRILEWLNCKVEDTLKLVELEEIIE